MNKIKWGQDIPGRAKDMKKAIKARNSSVVVMCILACVFLCMCMYAFVYMYLYIFVCTCVLFLHVWMCARENVFMQANVFICIFVHAYWGMHVHVFVCICTCVCAHV